MKYFKCVLPVALLLLFAWAATTKGQVMHGPPSSWKEPWRVHLFILSDWEVKEWWMMNSWESKDLCELQKASMIQDIQRDKNTYEGQRVVGILCRIDGQRV